MKKNVWSILLLCFLVCCYAFVFSFFQDYRNPVKRVQGRGLILPSVVMKVLALEFRTITADFLFARASQYYGGRINIPGALTINDYRWLYSNLMVITDLDPYFEDPYHLGNAILTWDVSMVKEADTLLVKATNARSWDWTFPFYLGFNKFYFLHEYREAADFMMIASKRPGAYDFLPTLAARLYNQEGLTELAIVSLKSFLDNERDDRLKKIYAKRLEALRRILFLEKAVARFKSKTKRAPLNLQALVQSGVITQIPDDPYGGVFYLEKDGSVQTTSKLAFSPSSPKLNKKVTDPRRN
jgi:hypothetical protein